jgi:hypothetical protein
MAFMGDLVMELEQQILDEGKSKHAGLAQENSFGSAFFLHKMLAEAAKMHSGKA